MACKRNLLAFSCASDVEDALLPSTALGSVPNAVENNVGAGRRGQMYSPNDVREWHKFGTLS